MSEFAFDLLGFVGVVFYLGTYGALQFGLIRGSSIAYCLGNLLGASLLMASLVNDYNQASLIVNTIWILISLVGLWRVVRMILRQRFTAEEEAIRQGLLSKMPLSQARTFFDLGEWVDLEPGFQLTEQGSPVETLYCVLSGQAHVQTGGHNVAVLTGGFVGEINVLDGRPASASVAVAAPARVFALRGTALRRKADRDSEFRSALEAALSRDTGRKLRAANQRVREALFH